MFCKKCGKEISPDALFCTSCGQRVSEVKAVDNTPKKEPIRAVAVQTVDSSKSASVDANKKSGKGAIIAIICLSVAALLIVAGIVFFVMNNASSKDEDAPADYSTETLAEDEESKEKEEDEEEKKAAEKEEATEVVEGFFEAYVDGDSKEAAKYVDDEDFLEDEQIIASKEQFIEAFLGEFPEEYKEHFESVAEEVADKAMEIMDYEIKDVEEDDDEFVFTVELTVLDSDALAENPALNEDAITELASELVESGEVTEDMTQDEIMEIYAGKLLEIIEDAEFDSMTNEIEIVVVKDGKDWVIDTEASEF